MPKHRMFSIPYNGSDPDSYINYMSPYMDHIENVFLGIPNLANNHHSIYLAKKRKTDEEYKKFYTEYTQNCFDFLTKTKGKVKRIITLNSGFYDFSNEYLESFVDKALRILVDEYEIDGFILTEFNMARLIHQKFPHLELHTSCNCFQWTIRTMKIWQQDAGITVFNPPREILRTPEKLKEMHDAGFKLKCLVNEGCLYGCPQTINHCMAMANKNFDFETKCNMHIENAFKGNFVLPRWLDQLDKYVDIYKISGRMANIDYIFRTLKAYLLGEDNINLLSIIIGGSMSSLCYRYIKEKLYIPTSDIPDKLLTCECKECDTCHICENLIKKYI